MTPHATISATHPRPHGARSRPDLKEGARGRRRTTRAFDAAIAERLAAGETVIVADSPDPEESFRLSKERRNRLANPGDEMPSDEDYARLRGNVKPLNARETAYLCERGLMATTTRGAAVSLVRRTMTRARTPRRQPTRRRTQVTRGSPTSAGSQPSADDDPEPPGLLRIARGTWRYARIVATRLAAWVSS